MLTGDGTVAALSQEQKVALATALVDRVGLGCKAKNYKRE